MSAALAERAGRCVAALCVVVLCKPNFRYKHVQSLKSVASKLVAGCQRWLICFFVQHALSQTHQFGGAGIGGVH